MDGFDAGRYGLSDMVGAEYVSIDVVVDKEVMGCRSTQPIRKAYSGIL